MCTKITFSVARSRVLTKLVIALALVLGATFAFSTITYADSLTQLDSSVYAINRTTPSQEYVIGIYPYTTLATFISNFSNSPSGLEVFDETGLVQITDPTDIIATGMKVNLVVASVTEESLTIVVRGDVNGDTVITSADVTHVKKYITGIEIPDHYQFLASELIHDGYITSDDPTILSEYISGSVTADAFNPAPPAQPPLITSTSPSTSTTGETITISGLRFADASAITIGGTACASFSIINATTATCVLPAKSPGTYAIAMTNPVGSSNANVAVGYMLSLSITAPTVDQVLPAGTTSTALTVTTNANTTCKYGTTNQPYALLTNTFSATGATAHSANITGLANGTDYTFYVACSTTVDDMTTTTATVAREFSVDVPAGPPDLGLMQNLTNANCPTTLSYAQDARNNQSYYVQKIAGLCWMLSNLRYAGGGTNTFGDTKTIKERPSGNPVYTPAEWMNAGGSTDFANTDAFDGFFGYVYNWCAAMGGQSNACNSTSTTGFNTSTSICPAGWRLPTGGSGGEFAVLNNTVNGGLTDTDAGLRANFLTVYAGFYWAFGGMIPDGSHLWSSTGDYANSAHQMLSRPDEVSPATSLGKSYASSVRCVR